MRAHKHRERTDSDETSTAWLAQRLWRGAFGALLCGVVGMIAAATMHADLAIGALVGACLGFTLGFLLGLDAIEAVMHGLWFW